MLPKFRIFLCEHVESSSRCSAHHPAAVVDEVALHLS